MKKIPLTQGQVARVDDADYEWLKQYKWCAHKIGHTFYAERGITISPYKQKMIRMHRVILDAPDGTQVDHKNTDGLDNRRSNLRFCTHSENCRNQRINRKNKSGFKGVSFSKRNAQNPWLVLIQVNSKRIHVGYYQTAEMAAAAYDLAALKHYGEFALTNKMLGLYEDRQ